MVPALMTNVSRLEPKYFLDDFLNKVLFAGEYAFDDVPYFIHGISADNVTSRDFAALDIRESDARDCKSFGLALICLTISAARSLICWFIA